jgi:hypothetical protein
MELATDHRKCGRRLIRLRSNRGRGRMVTESLTWAPEIAQPVVRRVVIEMRGRQHDPLVRWPAEKATA